MFFKSKEKESKNKAIVSPKVQTAEGWKRMMLQKAKEQNPKKT